MSYNLPLDIDGKEGSMDFPLSVYTVGDIIVARLQGVPTETLLRQCQTHIKQIATETGKRKVIYDVLKMTPPSIDATLFQRDLVAQSEPLCFQQAIVVPSCKIAYLARLAFGDGNYRVFYDDLSAARTWLSSS